MDETVRVTRHAGWAVIRIDREARRNALDRATRHALAAALANLRGDTRAIVLTGTGASFCAGLDLREREEERAAGAPDLAGQEAIELNLAMRAHPAIFIAAVNGLALGGGVTLVNSCDLAIASSTAALGCPEIGFANYASMAGPTSQLLLTRKRAAWLLLTTERIDAATAADWGLVNEVVPPAQLDARAAELAVRLAGFDAVALAETKAALEKIPAEITRWREAMDYGQTVNARIRERTAAASAGLTPAGLTPAGLAHSNAGGRHRGQGT
ncbi:enoyl-CoA hydratase/isomerase family protein [Cupriavidus pauculus]|uniref:Enoyl-CoA hydratase/isomerase family protein n=1 Tax=Cupriavidus pauculus TaxID=82633 RepID=A0A5P2GYA4_9BURK|nr:enoyl-CoA hydratase/isomerase family protein [Cupriavidus pauculus]QET00657.1 enoyl-CoA hydratase/isomerase family protein [Cupriavidus pauculus]